MKKWQVPTGPTPGPIRYDNHGGMLFTIGSPYGQGVMHFADLRGWGHLTGTGACHLTPEQAAAIQDATGERLALAWNAHDELLEAARKALAYLDTKVKNHEGDEHILHAYLSNAIKKAEGR